jgi:hypothetical protein
MLPWYLDLKDKAVTRAGGSGGCSLPRQLINRSRTEALSYKAARQAELAPLIRAIAKRETGSVKESTNKREDVTINRCSLNRTLV